MLQVSVLGPVEVRHAGRLVPLPAGKTSELLVRLALDAGVPVRADRLVDDLWGADAVRTSRNTLQSKVAKLRRALGDPSAVAGTDGGYRLAVESGDVDALAVADDAVVAARLLDAGDDAGAADRCAVALDRYRGDVLPGAGDEEWAVPHRVRLEAIRTQLVEIRAAARLRLGAVGEVIAELEAAVAVAPYQESLWALLVTALYRAGRQADALATYQRVRARLADDLGLEPGPQLQQLELQILQQDASLGGARGPAAAPGEAVVAIGNLPTMSADLVGRDREIEALGELLATERLVELVGPGGIGKTAVAIATARRSTLVGGAWLARLETAVTAADVVDTVLAALDVTGGEAALRERLKSQPTLVILDNCEHVVDAAADLAVRLLDAAPGLRLVCTSQVPLDVEGETLVELAPLALADAVALFDRRAVAPRHGGSRAPEAVRELCRSLDGLPLAIELAAARTRTLSIEEITRRLDDRFSVLSDPTSRRPERRRALRATIGWSYELLFADDQRGLWALATFAGGAPLPAVEAVLAALDVPPRAAIDVVGRLVGRSLVIVDETAAGQPRYRLLDSIRAFALEAMADAQLADRALAAHAAWFAEAAASSTAGVRSSRQGDFLAFARTERANIDASLAWCAVHDPQRSLAIASGFGWAWVVLGDSRGAQRLVAALDAAGSAAPAHERATAMLLASWLEASTGDLERATTHLTAAAELAEADGDVDLQARCCYYLAYVVSHHGQFREAIALTDRSRELYAGLDRPWDQAACWLFTARAAISAGDVERSVAACEQVEHSLRVVDDPWLHVRRDAMLGELARVQHRFDDAVRHIGRAAEASRRLGFLQTEAYQLTCLGRAQCQAGDDERGAATIASAIDKAEATGDVRMAALARVHLGRVLRALGHDQRAREALTSATAWHRAAGGGEQAALGECLLAALDAADGRPGASGRLTEILAGARVDDEPHVEVFALDALARLALMEGDSVTADELRSLADRRMAVASHFISERDRTDAAAVRAALVASRPRS